jgi:hypothetical protein
VRVMGSSCETTPTSESVWAERCRKHVTQAGHYEQQCKTGWKKSLHLLNLERIITYPIQSANLMTLRRRTPGPYSRSPRTDQVFKLSSSLNYTRTVRRNLK